MNALRRIDLRLVVALLLLALVATTAHRVFTAPLWGDELRTWRDGIERPLGDVLRWQHNPDHAPLGHLLARGGAALFGIDHPWSMRLCAWLCGLACVPMLFLLGRRVHSDAAGVLMALMFVVDPTQVFQLTQARMYAPLMLAGVTSLVLAVGLLGSGWVPRMSTLIRARTADGSDGTDERTHPWHPCVAAIGLGFAIGVGIWSHAQIFAVIFAILIAAIVRLLWHGRLARDSEHGRDARATKVVAALATFGVMIGLAIGAQGVAKLIHNRGKPPVVDANVTVDPPPEQLEYAAKALTGHGVLTAMVVGGSAIGLVVIGRSRGAAVATLLGATIVLAAINLLIAARYRPVAHARYLSIAQPAIWAAIAALLVEFWRWPALSRGALRGVPIAAMVGFAGLCCFQFSRTLDALPEFPLAAPFRDACAYVRAHRAPDSKVVVLPGSPLQMYARFYGLDTDTDLDAALTKSTAREQRRSPALSTDRELWLIGITPTSLRWRGTGDDPLVADKAIANVRHASPTTLPTTTDLGQREVIVVRYGPNEPGERLPLAGRAWPGETVGE